MTDYVWHKHLKKVGRVCRRYEHNGDVEVDVFPMFNFGKPEWSGVGDCYWFSYNVIPLTLRQAQFLVGGKGGKL